MTRKYFVLIISLMVLFMFELVGCSSAPTETTPTPDLSIVLSDDFEDGDNDGWRGGSSTHFFVKEGVLNNGEFSDGFTYHASEVSSGTWSFDIFFPEESENYVPFHEYGLTCDKLYRECFGINSRIEGSKNTSVSIITIDSGQKHTPESVKLGKRLVGWNHFDITRDESGNSKVYLNKELILEHKDEIIVTPDRFVINTNVIGPVFDNLVVSNQVIGVQLPEE